MWQSASETWRQRIREIGNHLLVDERAARLLASRYAAEATAKTLQLLLKLGNDPSPKALALPPNVSPLGSGIVWRRSIALMIGSMQPFPLDAVRALLRDTSVRRADASLLAMALVEACQNDPPFIDLVAPDIAMTAASVELEDTLELFGLVRVRSRDVRIIEAVARGLTFHDDRLKVDMMMRIEVAWTLLSSGSSVAEKYVEMAYAAVTPNLIASLNPRTRLDAEWVVVTMILRCLVAYGEMNPPRKAEAEAKRRLVLDRCPADLRRNLEAGDTLRDASDNIVDPRAERS